MEALRWRKPALKPLQINTSDRDELAGKGGGSGGGDDQLIEHEPLSPTVRMFHVPNFRFTSLQVVDEKDGGVMKWVPTKAKLEKHIIVPTIPQNLDSSPDKFLEDYIYNLTKTSIDPSQPMWDLHLLNLKTSDADAIGVFRIHHSLGDGTSLMSLLLACTSQISNPDAVPTIPAEKIPKRQRSSGGTGWWLWRCLVAVWTFFQLVWNTVMDVAYFAATGLFLKDTETPLKAPPGAEHLPRRIVYWTVSLDDMKLVKNAMNMTINDVALGVTQAGLSRYLNRRYGAKVRTKMAMRQRREITSRRTYACDPTLLVNIRPSSGIQALSDMMEKNTEAKWGNWIGYVILPFTIGLRDDPLDYVKEAKATIDRNKRSLEAIYAFSIAELVLKLFGIKAASVLLHRIITHTTMCFSNLVGPLEDIGFYGHALEFLAPSSYGQPHGLMINFQSCVNKMTIVLSVEENTIPDPHKLLDDLEGALKLIKGAVLEKGLVKEY